MVEAHVYLGIIAVLLLQKKRKQVQLKIRNFRLE